MREGYDPLKDLTCEVCNTNKALGVACVPGVAMSCAFCEQCLSVGAIPYAVAVANTACCGGWENCAFWWQETCKATLQHLGKSMAEFEADVKKDLDEMDGNQT